METRFKGYAFAILSAIIFGSMPLMAKHIYEGGGNAISLVFYRSFLAMPTLFFLLYRNRGASVKINCSDFKKIVTLVALGYGLTPILLYSSYNYISSGVATTIHFTYPIFVLIGGLIFLKSKSNRIEMFCVLLCSIGIFMITDIGQINSILGVGLAFASGVSYAFYALYLDKSGLKKLNQYKLCFYMALITSTLSFIYAALTNSFVITMSIKGWILSLFFANIITVGAVLMFQLGIKYIGPQKTSILSTFEPITSLILGILFLGETISMVKVIAILFILVSCLLLSIYDI